MKTSAHQKESEELQQRRLEVRREGEGPLKRKKKETRSYVGLSGKAMILKKKVKKRTSRTSEPLGHEATSEGGRAKYLPADHVRALAPAATGGKSFECTEKAPEGVPTDNLGIGRVCSEKIIFFR